MTPSRSHWSTNQALSQPTQFGWSERAQGGTVQGGVPVIVHPAPSPADSLDPRDELKGRRQWEQLGAHCQHWCVFRVSSPGGNYVTSITGYEVFITIAVTLISNIVPIGTRAFALLSKWSFVQSSKKAILSIPPTPSKEREREKGKRSLMLLSKGMWATEVQPHRKLPGTDTNNSFHETHACYTPWYCSFGRAAGRQGGEGGLSLLSKPWPTHEESCGSREIDSTQTRF